MCECANTVGVGECRDELNEHKCGNGVRRSGGQVSVLAKP